MILTPARAEQLGVTSTICFPHGNLAPARVFLRETDAIAAVKGQTDRPLKPGDVLVLMGRGPLGSGMEEIFQITSALRHLLWGHEVAVVTDARFSGVSTGACIGLVVPEALAGGPHPRSRSPAGNPSLGRPATSRRRHLGRMRV